MLASASPPTQYALLCPPPTPHHNSPSQFDEIFEEAFIHLEARPTQEEVAAEVQSWKVHRYQVRMGSQRGAQVPGEEVQRGGAQVPGEEGQPGGVHRYQVRRGRKGGCTGTR